MKGIKQVIEALKKAGAEVLEVNPVHDLFVDVDYYGLLEETVAALGTQDEEGNIYLREVYESGYRSGKSLTAWEKMKHFCEMFGRVSDDSNDIFKDTLTEEDVNLMKIEFYERYPELKQWLDTHMQKPCGEIQIPLRESVKCLSPSDDIKFNVEGVRTGRISSKKENKSNDPKGI